MAKKRWRSAVATVVVAALMMGNVTTVFGQNNEIPRGDRPGSVTEKVEFFDKSKSAKISVMSDTHLLPESMIADNKAFDNALNSDRKLLEESEGILKTALDAIGKNGSDIVLATGDLTKDGEYKSHETLASGLKTLEGEKPGRRIFVVPGNHDIHNKHAEDYNVNGSGVAGPAKGTTPDDFMKIYNDLVYSKALELYKNSEEFKAYQKKVGREGLYAHGYNSYVARVDLEDNKGDNGLTIIGLDTAQYSPDSTISGKDKIQDTEGHVSMEQMQWLREKVKDAQKRNDVVFVLAHHAFTPRFAGQPAMLKEYILTNWNEKILDGKTPMEILADSGVKYLFTGHMHAQDISRFASDEGNVLYEIETGSILTYPSPVRHMELTNGLSKNSANINLNIRTELLNKVKYNDRNKTSKEIENLTEHGSKNLITPELLGGLADYYLGIPQFKEMQQKGFKTALEELMKSNSITDKSINDFAWEMLKGKLGDKANPGVKMSGSMNSNISIYMGEILTPRIYGAGEKIAIDVAVPFFGTYPFMISKAKFNQLLDNMLKSFDEQYFQNTSMYNPWLTKIGAKALSYVIYERDGEKKTLSDLANYVYLQHLKGDEEQPDWVKESIVKFRDQEELKKIIAHVMPTLEEILMEAGDNIKIQPTAAELVEYDYNGSSSTARTIEAEIEGKIGTTVSDTIRKNDMDIKPQLLNLLEGDKAKEYIGSLSKMVADVVDGMTNENHSGYDRYKYLEDNNTTLKWEGVSSAIGGRLEITGKVATFEVRGIAGESIEKVYLTTADGKQIVGMKKEAGGGSAEVGHMVAARASISPMGSSRVVADVASGGAVEERSQIYEFNVEDVGQDMGVRGTVEFRGSDNYLKIMRTDFVMKEGTKPVRPEQPVKPVEEAKPGTAGESEAQTKLEQSGKVAQIGKADVQKAAQATKGDNVKTGDSNWSAALIWLALISLGMLMTLAANGRHGRKNSK